MAGVKNQQKKQIIEWLGDNGRVVTDGTTMKRYVLQQGWNVWAMSITISQMCNDGLIEALGPLRYEKGAVFKKSYRATVQGKAWVAALIPEELTVTDHLTSDQCQQAMSKARGTPGKWVMAPKGLSGRDAVLLKDQGFETRRVIRFVGVEND